MLPNTSLYAWCTMRPKKAQSQSLEQRKFYCRTMQEDQVVRALKNTELPKGFQQSAFKGKVRMEAQFVVGNLLVSEPFVLAAIHVGQVWCSYKTPTEQMLFSVLQLFSLYECTLDYHNPKSRLFYIFQAISNILLQKVQTFCKKKAWLSTSLKAQGLKSEEHI